MTPGFYPPKFKCESEDGHHFVLLEDVVFVRRDGSEVRIPAGSETDGLSTPQAGWDLLPPFGKSWRAGVLHDWAYRYSDKPKDWCDDLLLEAMQVLGVPNIERVTIYEGVHLGGWKSFEEDRKNQGGITQ